MADEIVKTPEELAAEEAAAGKVEKTISESQLKAILRSSNEKYERVASELAELKAAKAAPAQLEPEKRFTKVELKAAVTAGQVTEEQADALWEKQLRQDVAADVRREVLQAVGANTRQERVTKDLAEYKRLAPEILDESSDKRRAIAEEFQYLTGIGQAKSLETELAAIRAVLGPIDKLTVARSARRESEQDEQTGGGESRQRGAAKTQVETLTAREKDYYDTQIKKGVYKDWKQVESELAYARPEVRRKAGARV